MDRIEERTEELKSLLYNKIKSEYDALYTKLLTFTPEEVIKRSYELLCKENFLSIISFENFTYEQVFALNNLEKPLEAMYQEWLHTEDDLMEQMRDSVSKLARDELEEKPELVEKFGYKSFKSLIDKAMKESLKGDEVIASITWIYSNEKIDFTNPEEFLKTYKDALYTQGLNAVNVKVMPGNPDLAYKVCELQYNEYGLEPPTKEGFLANYNKQNDVNKKER